MNKNPPKENRRHSALNRQVLWPNLNDNQKISANALFNYGFELSFIRNHAIESLVGLVLDGKTATINNDGDIDTSPDINIRQ
ncbi:hypothetical protein AADZ86_16090 [Colwelliaceae bacterium BS250]